jgi:hypothetical protein
MSYLRTNKASNKPVGAAVNKLGLQERGSGKTEINESIWALRSRNIIAT